LLIVLSPQVDRDRQRAEATYPQLIASAAQHAEDHGTAGNGTGRFGIAAAGASPISFATSTIDGDDSDDGDHDDIVEPSADEEDEDEDEADDTAADGANGAAATDGDDGAARRPLPKRRQRRHWAKLTVLQRNFALDCMARVMHHGEKRLWHEPEVATMQKLFNIEQHKLCRVCTWAPHVQFRDRGVPDQPPCPRHGFDAVAAGWVKPYGVAKPRSFCDVSLETSGLCIGTLHICRQCQRDRAEAKGKGDLLYKQIHFRFRSYNDDSMAHWRRHLHFAFVAHEFPLWLTNGFALTNSLVLFVSSLCTESGGSNPNAVAELLDEVHDRDADWRRLVMLESQLATANSGQKARSFAPNRFAKRRVNAKAGEAQLETIESSLAGAKTLLQAWSDPDDQRVPEDFVAADIRRATPSAAYLRGLVQVEMAAKAKFEEQFMEQRIGGTRIAIDHHSKVSHGCNYLLDSLRETTINIIIIIIIAIS
jgi:hypothetical protein